LSFCGSYGTTLKFDLKDGIQPQKEAGGRFDGSLITTYGTPLNPYGVRLGQGFDGYLKVTLLFRLQSES
jgi:hypothetical protein